MAKIKKFRHKTPRPSLAASLEAVRQGRVLEPAPQVLEQEKVETAAEKTPAVAPHPSGEAAYVKAEVRRITLSMGVLIALLVGLTITETRTGFLTESAKTFLVQ